MKIDQWEGKDGIPHAQLRVHAKYIDFLNIGKKQEAVVGMVFWHLQFYESAIFILLSWTALLSLYFAGEETKSVEREHTIQELQKHNEKLQETVNLNKGSMSLMTKLYQRARKVDYR